MYKPRKRPWQTATLPEPAKARTATSRKPRKRPRPIAPRLTIDQILAWADIHRERTGNWPNLQSGRVYLVPFETWYALNKALFYGRRGLPGGTSLIRLLAEHRGVRNRLALPPLSIEQILAWADAHRERTGNWPRMASGRIHGEPFETWFAVDGALRDGRRGLPAGSSLAILLRDHRGKRYFSKPATFGQADPSLGRRLSAPDGRVAQGPFRTDRRRSGRDLGASVGVAPRGKPGPSRRHVDSKAAGQASRPAQPQFAPSTLRRADTRLGRHPSAAHRVLAHEWDGGRRGRSGGDVERYRYRSVERNTRPAKRIGLEHAIGEASPRAQAASLLPSDRGDDPGLGGRASSPDGRMAKPQVRAGEGGLRRDLAGDRNRPA